MLRCLDRGLPAPERGGESALLRSVWSLECTGVHALTGVVNELAEKVTIARHLDGAECHTAENVPQDPNAVLRRQEE